jgi:hypothetical protein
MGAKNSKRWSMKDIKTIEKFIKDATDAGQVKEEGIKLAAKHFGVTINALRIRYGRYCKGKQVAGLKKNTTKVPMKRKKRKYTKRAGMKPGPKPKHLIAESNKLVFPLALLACHVPKITAITVDFDTRSVTYTY